MIKRNSGTAATTYTFTYDSENRMVNAKNDSNTTDVTYVFDGDGRRVKSTQILSGVTSWTTLVGNYFEWNGTAGTKYYFAGGQRIAFRSSSGLYYIFSDHLGSASVKTDGNGGSITRYGYYPFGEERYGSTALPYQYTGQRKEASIGLYDYNARFYDSYITQFTQPDSIIPDPYNPMDWNRYAYVRYNPIRYTDPTGHITQGEEKDAEKILKLLANYNVSISVDWGMKKKKWQDGLWTLSELQMVLDSVQDLSTAMGGADKFKTNLDGVTITQKDIKYGGLGEAHKVTLSASGFTKWTVVHELTHAWDGVNGWKLSSSMGSSMGAGFDHPILHFLFPNNPAYWYDPGQGPPPCGVDANFNSKEDFAEAVTAYTYPSDASAKATANGWPYKDAARGYSYSSYIDTPRGQYILALMVSNP